MAETISIGDTVEINWLENDLQETFAMQPGTSRRMLPSASEMEAT